MDSNSVLQKIHAQKIIEVRNRKKIQSLSEICKKIKCADKPNNFYETLLNKNLKNELGLICEIKRGSPSAGIIKDEINIKEIVKNYEANNASCISVLTDENFFYSNDSFLIEARQVTNLPLLRKDFMVDAYQIYESRMFGADCILLIVAMLDDKKLQELENIALELGLSVLIEVHDEEELKRALKLRSRMIGINNRNLKNLQVDLNICKNLYKFIPAEYLVICESGIRSKDDIDSIRKIGINCFLIGEYFMRNISQN
jgi:indole-3-glycerol phosphate synthase